MKHGTGAAQSFPTLLTSNAFAVCAFTFDTYHVHIHHHRCIFTTCTSHHHAHHLQEVAQLAPPLVELVIEERAHFLVSYVEVIGLRICWATLQHQQH